MATKKKDSGSAQPTVEELEAFVRANTHRLLTHPNATSVGVGYKIQDGKEQRKLCISFTVSRKSSPETLEAAGVTPIPKYLEVDGKQVPTDVIERTYKPAYIVVPETTKPDRKRRADPIRPGQSVGHGSTTAGTLGVIVYDRATGAPCMLSNWHVFHTPHGQIGDAVYQPGPHDDNHLARNRAGILLRSHLGEAGDCAIGRIEGRGFNRDVLELNTTPTKIGKVQLGDRVVKSGRTTGVTHGVVRRVSTAVKLDYDEAGEKVIGCFEIGPDPALPAPDNEVSQGGDSGSGWLAKEGDKTTDVLVGLHFAGEGMGDPDEHALACYAHAVFNKLDISLEKPTEDVVVTTAPGVGYDPGFLGTEVPLPQFDPATLRTTVLTLPDGSPLLHYTHFSLAMHKERRMAIVTACNIDGSHVRRLSRNGIEWRLDPRIPERAQWGNELYAGNRLDRGHLVRRLDAVWGEPTEARRANADTFHYTNACPQHEGFNQAKWNDLEDWVYEAVDVQDQRAAVFTGPIFGERDVEYRGARLPLEFWKVLVLMDASTQTLNTLAFVMSQEELLDKLEAIPDLGQFATYQVPLAYIEARTGLSFGTLRPADPLYGKDIREGRIPVVGPESLRKR